MPPKPNLLDIQSGILKHHGRNHVRCFLIRFTSHNDESIKSWISGKIAPLVTNAKKQLDDTANYRSGQYATSGTAIFSFFLSRSGYEKLFPREQDKRHWPKDPSFRKGMKAQSVRERLNDPPLEQWEPRFRENADAMILVADDHLPVIESYAQTIIQLLGEEDIGTLLFEENGKAFRLHGQTVEHFGYADGISDLECIVGETVTQNGLDHVLIEEGDGRYGSYLVFRKLEQNVKVFFDEIKRVTEALGIEGHEEFIGAQAIGRFRNGMPLTLSKDPYSRDVSFGRTEMPSDAGAIRCPFHAHARVAKDAGDDGILIARRGITYDEIGRDEDFAKKPREGVGLLFMSFQKGIYGQFEKLQRYLNSDRYPERADPIAGQPAERASQNWNVEWVGHREWGNGQRVPTIFASQFSKVVTLKGGDYFYAPSLTFLRTLDGKPRPAPPPPNTGYRRNSSYWYQRFRQYKP